MAVVDTIKRLFSNEEDDLYEKNYGSTAYQEQPQPQQTAQRQSQQQTASYFAGRQTVQQSAMTLSLIHI